MVTLIDNSREKSVTPRLRHPEKQNRRTTPLRKPDWIRVRAPGGGNYAETKRIVRSLGLHTVCEEAACPNIGGCWQKKHATLMIMGEICTRACAFCNVITGKPMPLDKDEPAKVAIAVEQMALKHVVITSVDRDDLADGGAAHFAGVINAIRQRNPTTTIEVLTPDFLRKNGAETLVFDAQPDVFNHNLETVPGLYATIRPGARYFHSLRLLQKAKEYRPTSFTKSGLMLGLGETRRDVLQVMDDMRCADVDFITLGQYLQPTPHHAPVARYVPPEEFDYFASIARAKGFLMVSSSPLTRSSFHAGDDFAQLQRARTARRNASSQ